MPDGSGEDRLLDQIEARLEEEGACSPGPVVREYRDWLARLCARVRHLEAESARHESNYLAWKATAEESGRLHGKRVFAAIETYVARVSHGERLNRDDFEAMVAEAMTLGVRNRVGELEAASQRLTEALTFVLGRAEETMREEGVNSDQVTLHDYHGAHPAGDCKWCQAKAALGAGAPPEGEK